MRVSVICDPGRPSRVDLTAIVRGADTGTVAKWLRSNREAVLEALRTHGALYFANAKIGTREAFGEVRDALFSERGRYEQRATPRTDFGDDVFSSTDFPASQSIRPHNENSYTLRFPGFLLFGCMTAPAAGGATVIVDVRKVLGRIPRALALRFRERGWLLRRVYHGSVGMPWQKAFDAESPADVESYCRENAVAYEWVDGGTLVTTQRRPAIVRHPVTGEEVWFNHAAFWSEWSLDAALRDVLVERFGHDRLPFNTMFGDDSPLTAEDAACLNAAYDAHLVREPWHAGDLLLVDNVAAAHGRDAFKGHREVVVAMGNPIALSECDPSYRATPSA